MHCKKLWLIAFETVVVSNLQPRLDPEVVGMNALSTPFVRERVFMLIDISIDI